MSVGIWEQISHLLCPIEYFVVCPTARGRSHLWSTKRTIWIFYWKFTAKIRENPHPCGWQRMVMHLFVVDSGSSCRPTIVNQPLTKVHTSVHTSVKVHGEYTAGKATHYNSSIDVPLGSARIRCIPELTVLLFCGESALERWSSVGVPSW